MSPLFCAENFIKFCYNGCKVTDEIRTIKVKDLHSIERRQDMDDSRIIELYWQRSENAITETDKKYGAYCNTVAFNILQNKEDAEE